MAGITTPYTWFAGQIRGAVPLSDGVVTQQPGAAIQISASGAGTVTLTLWGGDDIVVNVAVGDSIYPYQVIKFVAGTAVLSAVYNLIA